MKDFHLKFFLNIYIYKQIQGKISKLKDELSWKLKKKKNIHPQVDRLEKIQWAKQQAKVLFLFVLNHPEVNSSTSKFTLESISNFVFLGKIHSPRVLVANLQSKRGIINSLNSGLDRKEQRKANHLLDLARNQNHVQISWSLVKHACIHPDHAIADMDSTDSSTLIQ